MREIPRVREDLGFIPLVTPTSQIVGSQAVINVLAGERYKTITKETAGVLKGEYGATPAPVNASLQQRVLDGAEPISCRPADLLEPELDKLTAELRKLAGRAEHQPCRKRSRRCPDLCAVPADGSEVSAESRKTRGFRTGARPRASTIQRGCHRRGG